MRGSLGLACCEHGTWDLKPSSSVALIHDSLECQWYPFALFGYWIFNTIYQQGKRAPLLQDSAMTPKRLKGPRVIQDLP